MAASAELSVEQRWEYCLFNIYVLELVSSVYTAVIAVPCNNCNSLVCIKNLAV